MMEKLENRIESPSSAVYLANWHMDKTHNSLELRSHKWEKIRLLNNLVTYEHVL